MSSSSIATLFTPLQFTGISQYSSDFQSILSRATSIARLPVQALANRQTTIQSQQTDLTTLGSAASAVTTALKAIGTLGSGGTLSASSSDTNVVTATNTGATSGASYSITNVTSIAAPAAETSTQSYGTSTAVSASGSMELVVGNRTYAIGLGGAGQKPNTLSGLADAINGLSNAGVTASILTTGSGNYLSLAANSPGTTTLQLIENPTSATNTLTTTAPGSSTVAASATFTAPLAAVSPAVSASGAMALVVGGTNYSIGLGGTGQQPNTLSGLAAAINGLNAGVTASITLGQLSITANSVGTNTLQLLDNPTNFITSANQGSNTNFNLNGIAISEPSTTVNDVIPGLILKFSGKTTANETVAVKVAVDRTQIQSALQNLVTSYNTLASAETAQFSNGTKGSNAGTLSGNNIVYQIRQAMSSIVQYQGSGTMSNLANLGISLSDSGQMSLNTQTAADAQASNAISFSALSDSDIAASLQLLGSSTTGIGGLQQMFSSITDPILGSIAEQQNQWTATTTNLTDQINTKNTQILAMEQTLNRQLAAADSSVAQLASQQNILTASITSLNYTSYGYNTNISSSK